jgi:hypothetical protein
MRRMWAMAAAVAAVVGANGAAAAPLQDGPLGRFVGDWTVTGTTRGRPAATGAEVRPVFGGAFLELHVKDPAGRSPYEARVFFGQDAKGALVVHWLDATGGETSRTLGSGEVRGDAAVFRFPYPDGEFRDRLEYDRAHDRWRLLIVTGPEAQPKVFSDWVFERATPER